MKYFIKIFFIVAVSCFIAGSVFAAMTGNTYRIDSDSINSGGLDDSSAGGYQMSDTVGEVATGESGSVNYDIAAGYRQMEESSVTIGASVQDVIMLPSLAGLSGGTSTGITGITVVTDNVAGYMLTISAADSPALRSADDSFSDYTPASSDPDFQLAIPGGGSVFAFTAKGSDSDSRYRDNGSTCGVLGGSATADRCWDGLSTTSRVIAESAAPNVPLGTLTTVKFSSGVGSNRLQRAGAYVATTTITAVAL